MSHWKTSQIKCGAPETARARFIRNSALVTAKADIFMQSQNKTKKSQVEFAIEVMKLNNGFFNCDTSDVFSRALHALNTPV